MVTESDVAKQAVVRLDEAAELLSTLNLKGIPDLYKSLVLQRLAQAAYDIETLIRVLEQ